MSRAIYMKWLPQVKRTKFKLGRFAGRFEEVFLSQI